MKMAEVVFQPEGKRVNIRVGQTILEAARLAGADLISTCGGKANCGKCRIINQRRMDSLEPLTTTERNLLSPKEIAAGYRLACRATVRRNITVQIPEESRTGKARLQIEGIKTHVKLERLVRKYVVRVSSPTLEDIRSDSARMLNELETKYHLKNLSFDLLVLQQLPLMLRKLGCLTVVVWNDSKIIAIEAGDTTERVFGCAVDVGTTKLAGYLVNLDSGDVVAADSLMNPQISFGEDVIARIAFARKGPREQKQLHRILINSLNEILKSLLEKASVRRREVYEMTVVGNTAMHHMFLNIPTEGLALSPYAPATKSGLDVKAKTLGLSVSRNANVHVLPVVAGFVGADAVAVTLATEIYRKSQLSLALDIGTNTEVVLGNKDNLFACSCASGPALEGAHVKYGMRAVSGAIEKVQIDPDTFEVEYHTIDNARPCGICGSGIVDAAAEMLRTGIVNVSGAMKKVKSSRLRSENGLEFVVAWGKETSTGKDISITQKDVRQIQSAKAAIHTGVLTLMKNAQVTQKDIDTVFIAGAFGSHVDPRNARVIGMYPEVALEKVKVVGNAAGTGARTALVSRTARSEAEIISGMIKYVELAADPDFQASFCNSLYLPYADLSHFPEASRMLRNHGNFPDRLPPILYSRRVR